jgi:hypothetical protein
VRVDSTTSMRKSVLRVGRIRANSGATLSCGFLTASWSHLIPFIFRRHLRLPFSPPSGLDVLASPFLLLAHVVHEHIFNRLVVTAEQVADAAAGHQVNDFFCDVLGVIAGAFK